MSAYATEAQLCNAALIRIGAETISALADLSKNANLCNEIYAPTRDWLLRRFRWAFAIRRFALAESSNTNNTPYDNIYALPSNLLRVVDLLDEDGELSTQEWIIEGNDLFTDLDDAMLRYIRRVSDPADFDDGFANALACRLAWLLCLKITQKLPLRRELFQEYLFELGEAKMVDASEKISEPDEPRLWTTQS